MRYELFYQPSIQGRGEYIRLALEDAGADYIDVARDPEFGRPGIVKILEDPTVEQPSYAPPFLKAGKLMIGQTANILQYLGPRLGLAPRDQAGKLWVHQLQLTITDWVAEIGAVHHPIANALYYEEQKAEAKKRASYFTSLRIPKFFGYYENILQKNPKRSFYLLGKQACYADLSLFQVVAGLRYAFPRTMAKIKRTFPNTMALHDRVASRPRLKKYLASPRRLPFNQNGIFRHYPELDK